jgi:hypothetical protein
MMKRKGVSKLPTEKQSAYIHALAKEKGMDHDMLKDSMGFGLDELTSQEASDVIEWLQGKRADIAPLKEKYAAQTDEDRAFTQMNPNLFQEQGIDPNQLPHRDVRDIRDVVHNNNGLALKELMDKIKAAHEVKEEPKEEPKKEPVKADAHEPVKTHDHSVRTKLEARMKKIDEVYKCMQKGVDYGVVEGYGKPSLFKPGAEMLAIAFDLAVQQTTEIRQEQYLGLDVVVAISHATSYEQGIHLADGIGVCHTGEKKYATKYGKPITPEEQLGNLNTIAKMAEKRAYVDVILRDTGASRIFTQDMEDLK